jgi:hypothetical protein
MPTLKGDLEFGTKNEVTVHSTLENVFEKKLIRRGGYSTFDYDDGGTFFVELKTRRINHDMYPTSLIGANKVAIAANNPNKKYWFCFSYLDGLYGLEYNKDLFATFDNSSYTRGARDDCSNNVQQCYFIPIEKLQKLN